MKAHPTIFLLTDGQDSLPATCFQGAANAAGWNLITKRLGSGTKPIPEINSGAGVIHLDSAWELTKQRDQIFQELCDWVQFSPRHAFHLPGSLRKLSAEAQDSLGRDLSALASCREENFLIVVAKELEKEPILASLKLWLVPQVPIVFYEAPSSEKSGEGPTPPPELVQWFQ